MIMPHLAPFEGSKGHGAPSGVPSQKQHGDHDNHPTLAKLLPKLNEYMGSIGKNILPDS